VAIVGPHNAGKTTMLGAAYLALSRTGIVGPDRFAGSYTLGGWEAVAHGMRWRPGAAPGFPPHTASGAGRAPGLLHLALRRPSGKLTDMLVTDAPGEWFTRWAYDREATEAAGARWVARHTDAFVLVLDSEALAGPSRGEARGEISRLAQRLGAERHGRPVAAVWTKVDVGVVDGIRTAVEELLDRFLPGARRFAVSVRPATKGGFSTDSFLDVLSWAVRADGRSLPQSDSERLADSRTLLGGTDLLEVGETAATSYDPFLTFRVSDGWSDLSRRVTGGAL
jgi:hypothetical protein